MRIKQELSPEFYSVGFNTETDLLGKSDLAKRLCDLYRSLTHGTVAILDGRWGSGKTVFAHQWKNYLEKEAVPCIYLDAFASDYIEDPFSVIATSLVKAAKSAKNADDAIYDNFLSALSRTMQAIAIPSAKIAIKAATLGLIGKEELKDFGDIIVDMTASGGDIAESGITALLEKKTQNDEKFIALKEALESLPNLMQQRFFMKSSLTDNSSSIDPPLIVIIDELDRCRPDFALNLLEVIKHFFGAKRIHFLIVTNLDHLRKSVDNRYGTGESSGEYLQKFYDFIIPFETSHRSNQLSASSVLVKRILENLFTGSNNLERQDLIEYAAHIAHAYGFSLRQAEKFASSIILCSIDYQKKTFRPAILIAIVAAIKINNPDLYYKILRNKPFYEDIMSFINRGEWPDSINKTWLERLMVFHSSSAINPNDPEYEGFSSEIWGYNFRSRLDIIPFIANNIVEKYF